MASLAFTPAHEAAHVYCVANRALKLTSADEIEPYLQELKALPKCTKIDFSGNTLGIGASRALASCISESASVRDHLQEINFADLYTSRLVDEVVESLEVFVPVWLACPQLAVVNLSDNAFGLRTIDSLERYLASAVQLEHLVLSNNGMGPFAGERLGKALFRLAQRKRAANKPPLQTFICGRNRLENGSALHLALGFKAHGAGLKVVRLYQNGIRPTGVATLITHGLRYNSQLEVLDLQDNTFTTRASEALARTLPTWKDTLQELNFNDCLLKGPGADCVVKVLQQQAFPELHTLKLQYNELTQDTLVESLLPALKSENLPALKFLELNGNRLEEDSDALAELETAFDGELDELDDLEELDSDEEEEEEDEEDEAAAEDLEIDIEALEKELASLDIEVDELAQGLQNTTL